MSDILLKELQWIDWDKNSLSDKDTNALKNIIDNPSKETNAMMIEAIKTW
jgi:hypothetical protein